MSSVSESSSNTIPTAGASIETAKRSPGSRARAGENMVYLVCKHPGGGEVGPRRTSAGAGDRRHDEPYPCL